MNSTNQIKQKAIAFDLGETLVEYEGLPPSWEAHYNTALVELTRYIGCHATTEQIRDACAILKRYNTRHVPRLQEVDFSTIFAELLQHFGVTFDGDAEDAAVAYFSIFRQRLRCYPDTAERLEALRKDGIRIGVLTDVPYGMPRRLVMEDMDLAGVLQFVDQLVTSVDAGVRKPSVTGLALLASRLQVRPSEITFVGNEKKDIDVALAFGCEAVLLDRNRVNPDWKQHRTISTLSDL